LNKHGRIHRFNHACEKLTGHSANEVIGEFVWDHFLVSEETEVVKTQAFEAHVNNPEQQEGGFTNYWVSKSGEKRLIEWKNSLLFDENGKIEFMVSIGTDITQHKADEEELERLVEKRTSELKAAQSELLKKERLSTLGELTATISHEIRNPLGAIQTNRFWLKKHSSEQDEKQKRALDSIERNVKRCDNIIDELLDFTRESKIDLDPTDIGRYLNRVIDEYSFPDGLMVERNIALDGILVNIDSGRLQRVFINVFNNAVEAMMDETNKELKKNAMVRISSSIDQSKVVLLIADCGPGIPENILPDIFKPLYSTKTFGVGLGMSIIKDIMEQHAGGVDISTASSGTVVSLWLPIAETQQ